MWVVLALAGLARAEVPLPSYEERLAAEARAEVDQLVEKGRYTEAIEAASRYERTVGQDAGLALLVGVSLRMQGGNAAAEPHLRRAVLLDPELAAAWSELGEVLLEASDLPGAARCFAEVTRLAPAGRSAWTAHARLAEIAALRRDPDAFEAHLREALRRGFTFRTIERDPTWARFYSDPDIRDSIDKMVTVYGDRAVLESLRHVEDPAAVQ